MKRIVCAVNERGHAQRALEVAIEIARGCGASLVLVVVNEAQAERKVRYSDDAVAAILDRAAARAREGKVADVARVVFTGDDVARAIVDCAQSTGADHIVVGTGAPSLIGRLLIGSVSDAVLKSAPCSVTLAR